MFKESPIQPQNYIMTVFFMSKIYKNQNINVLENSSSMIPRQKHTFVYAVSVSAMVRSNAAQAACLCDRLSLTLLSLSERTWMSCCSRSFSSSSCLIWRFNSSLLECSSSMPAEDKWFCMLESHYPLSAFLKTNQVNPPLVLKLFCKTEKHVIYKLYIVNNVEGTVLS